MKSYQKQLYKKTYLAPTRGVIEDRNGEPLALNQIGFSILIKPHLRADKYREKLEKLIDIVVEQFPQYDKNKLIKDYLREDSPYNHEFIKVIDYVPYEEIFSRYTFLATQEDIRIESSSKRHYPHKELAAHIIGYVSKASKLDIANNEIAKYSGVVGKSGIERYYNDKLQGTLGFKDTKSKCFK